MGLALLVLFTAVHRCWSLAISLITSSTQSMPSRGSWIPAWILVLHAAAPWKRLFSQRCTAMNSDQNKQW